MKKAASLAVAGIVILSHMGLSLAQTRGHKRHIQKPAGQGYFFMPPRNYFYLFPRYYPPFQLDAGIRRGGRYQSRYDGHHLGHRSESGSARHYDDQYYQGDYYGDDYYYPSPGQGIYTIYTQSPLRTEIVQANTSNIIFRVSPSKALVYINGKLIGSARDFSTRRDRYMVLEGEHELRIEYPGHQTFETLMEVIPNKTINLDIELQPLP